MSEEAKAPAQSTPSQTYPNESQEYRQARNALLEAEIALRRQIEAVAKQRRALPLGGEVPQDYLFHEGDDDRPVHLSELFGGRKTLIVYSFMYGPEMPKACPNCTSILDSLDGETPHVNQRAGLVVVAKSPIARILAFAKERGWRNLRLVSSAGTTYNHDYFGENAEGKQQSGLNVFTLRKNSIHHSYAAEMHNGPMDPGQGPRHVDSIWPLWGLLDFTPEGRGAFNPQLSYLAEGPS